MSKEILRPQKAQPAPLAHIVGEIDHMGKVWTPAAQPAQEPVAWLGFNPRSGEPEFNCDKPAPSVMRDFNMQPIAYTNTTPPQRKPLTDEQIEKCIEAADSKWADAFVSVEWARHLTKAIEAAHGIKETTK
jgi:hypothetical protein